MSTAAIEEAHSSTRSSRRESATKLYKAGCEAARAGLWEEADQKFRAALDCIRNESCLLCRLLMLKRAWLAYIRGDLASAERLVREVFYYLSGRWGQQATDLVDLIFDERAEPHSSKTEREHHVVTLARTVFAA